MKNYTAFIHSIALIIGLSMIMQIAYTQILINEYSSSNLSGFQDNYGEYEDWIELHNSDLLGINLGGYCLSDDPEDTQKWEFPFGVTIPSGGFLKIWATGRDEVTGSNYHTSFRLTQTKADTEYIVLTNPLGNIIDIQPLLITQKDHSRGRVMNGSSEWGVFTSPTPGNSNNNATAYLRYAEIPVMSDTAGFFPGPVTITITTQEPNSTLYFTNNGQTPTSSSTVYSGPIPVNGTTLLQARVISNDPQVLPGLIEFNTYFINEFHNTAVISASGNQLLNLLNGNSSLRPFGTMEYFNKQGVRTTRAYGEFNEHGQDSWVHDQRSIDYITRDECGYNYALQGKLLALTDREEFQRLIIRAEGDDNYPGIDTSSHTRDFIIQNLAEKIGMSLDVRKGERVVMYANGQFWGIYSIREKVNDHDFTDYYYGQGKYDLQFLMLWGGTWAEYGGQQAFTDWNALHDFIKFQDMTNMENYNYVTSQLDIASLVDYILINSYVVCSDWINWNVGWWRGLNPEGAHRKWGYILWDEDATFGHYINYTGVPGQNPYVSPCFPEGITSDPEEHIFMLNRLKTNPVFRQYYVSRYIDLINTGLHIDYVLPWIDSIASLIEVEMPRHVARWGGSVAEWETNVQKIRNFVTTRFGILNQGLINCYNLNGPYPITLMVEPEGTGEIVLNSLTLNDFPWQGNYFGGVDVLLNAIPSDITYEFDYWDLANHVVFPSDTLNSVSLNLFTSDTIIARFKPKVFADSLVINEICYNPHPDFDSEDWIEFYNPQGYELDITDWIFRDSIDEHAYVFPAGTLIDPYGYLVLCRDTAAFKTIFPEVTNFIGNMDFGLSGSGELIRLYNEEGALVDTVHYDDNAPWPTEPDGNGPTLELKDPALDNALAENWKASQDFGTPGEENSPSVGFVHFENPDINPRLIVSPNPFASQTMITIHQQGKVAHGELTLYNFFGDKVRIMEGINSTKVILNLGNLPSGIYILRYTDLDKGRTATAKLISE
ncbi:MAG: CotH kinase family protein [Bacteroidales bacterium]|nr:CotH kinase family protein [Bacteroidales bacterium]